MSSVASAPTELPEPAGSVGGLVHDFTQIRLERALLQRVRYRYVQPRVVREGETFRVESPCCSRNVDPDGGVIDIALLVPRAEHPGGDASPGAATKGWRLCARDHASATWVPKFEHDRLDELLDLLCVDNGRQFWL